MELMTELMEDTALVMGATIELAIPSMVEFTAVAAPVVVETIEIAMPSNARFVVAAAITADADTPRSAVVILAPDVIKLSRKMKSTYISSELPVPIF
jgi:hypothetical protein